VSAGVSPPSRLKPPSIGHNVPVGGHGKRAGARQKRSLSPRAIAFAGAGVAALVVWAYLVWAAIHFGSQARGGDHGDWWLAGLATVGAIVTLFACLVLLTQSFRGQEPAEPAAEATHSRGGKRAAR
jgi:NADH:ubiquinone oxidoreductase subunit 5 (subunit L)/multisubunit Na+/H+ antiporter MnhA subunit